VGDVQLSKTRRARKKFALSVPHGYSSRRHVGILAALTLLPLPFFIAVLFAFGAAPWMLLGIPIGIVIGNLVEYIMHRFPMHKLLRGRLAAHMYRRHAGAHHAMFTYDDMEAADERDLYHVMMTPRPAALFLVVIAVLVSSAFAIEGGQFAAVLGITLCIYFFLEELLHMTFHLRWTWHGTRWYHAMLRRIAAHHRHHHDPKNMRDVNFNIALPLFDTILGTGASKRQ
jgi:hypothetical protein